MKDTRSSLVCFIEVITFLIYLLLLLLICIFMNINEHFKKMKKIYIKIIRMVYPWADLKCNESVDYILKDSHNVP